MTSSRILLLGALTAAPFADSFTAHPQRSSTFVVGRPSRGRGLFAISENNNDNFNNNNNGAANANEDGGGGFLEGLSKLADSLTGGSNSAAASASSLPSPTELESTTAGIAATATDMYSESLSQLVNADAESASEYLESVQAQIAKAAVSPQRALFNDDGMTKSWQGDKYSLVSNAPTDVFITPINGQPPETLTNVNVVADQPAAALADAVPATVADLMANTAPIATTTTTTAAAAAAATTTTTTTMAAAATANSWSTSPSNTVISFPSTTNELIEHAEKLSGEMNTVINEIDAVLAGKTIMESDVLAASATASAATVAAPPVVAAATAATEAAPAVSTPIPEPILSSPVTASIGDSAMEINTATTTTTAATASINTMDNIGSDSVIAAATNDVAASTASTVAAETTSNDLTSQLSEMTYDSLAAASAPLSPTNPTTTTTTTNPLNKLLSEVATNANESLHTVQDGLTAQATTQAQGLNHAIGRALDVSKGRVVEQGNAWTQSGVKVASGVAAGGTAAVQTVGEKSIADLGADVVSGLQVVGHSMENGINMILSQIDYEHDTTVRSIVSGAQHSVDEAVNGAISSIMTTLDNIGNITLEQLASSFIQLLVTVVKFVFVVVSAIIQMLSGRGLDEWTMATIGAVEREATSLSTQASTALYDATHTSLADLGTSVGHFSHDVGQLVVQTIGILGQGLETAPGQLADIATLAGTM
jgi:hypothetical protein